MSEQTNSSEKEPAPRDISAEVARIIDAPPGKIPRAVILEEYLSGLRSEPAVTLTLDWRGPSWARWAKGFLEDFSALRRGQERTASIRCTESQKKEAANVFASGVRWINSEEEK